LTLECYEGEKNEKGKRGRLETALGLGLRYNKNIAVWRRALWVIRCPDVLELLSQRIIPKVITR
jgi:hypothetical protein